MDLESAAFYREARRRIAQTFPRNRLPFYQSLRPRPAFSAFQKIKKMLGDDEKSWHLFLLAQHVLYEGWHDLPPLSVAERKALRRDVQSLRSIAERLRMRRFAIEVDTESGLLEKLAAQLERVIQPSTEDVYNLVLPGRKRLDPREAIPIFELANLFGERLPRRSCYPVIADMISTLPGRSKNCNGQTVKVTLARLKEIGFQSRVRIEYPIPGRVTLKIRS